MLYLESFDDFLKKVLVLWLYFNLHISLLSRVSLDFRLAPTRRETNCVFLNNGFSHSHGNPKGIFQFLLQNHSTRFKSKKYTVT